MFVVYSPFPTAAPELSVTLNLAFAKGFLVTPSVFVMRIEP